MRRKWVLRHLPCVSGSLVHNYSGGGDNSRAAAAEYRAGRELCNAIPVRDAHDGIGMWEISDGPGLFVE